MKRNDQALAELFGPARERKTKRARQFYINARKCLDGAEQNRLPAEVRFGPQPAFPCPAQGDNHRHAGFFNAARVIHPPGPERTDPVEPHLDQVAAQTGCFHHEGWLPQGREAAHDTRCFPDGNLSDSEAFHPFLRSANPDFAIGPSHACKPAVSRTQNPGQMAGSHYRPQHATFECHPVVSGKNKKRSRSAGRILRSLPWGKPPLQNAAI